MKAFTKSCRHPEARTAQVHMPLLFSGFFLRVEGDRGTEEIKKSINDAQINPVHKLAQ